MMSTLKVLAGRKEGISQLYIYNIKQTNNITSRKIMCAPTASQTHTHH